MLRTLKRIDIYDLIFLLLIFISSYYVLSPSIGVGYPNNHTDATMAFYIAKVKMLMKNWSLYTDSWYFGFEMLKYYPPLSTYLVVFFAIVTGNLILSYYCLCFTFSIIFCAGIYFFSSRFYRSKPTGFLAAGFWVLTHVNLISFQGRYWEMNRLMGTALIPWVLFLLYRLFLDGGKKELVVAIFLTSFIFLSNLFSVIDFFLIIGPYILLHVFKSKIHRGNCSLYDHRGNMIIIVLLLGVFAFTAWWYIPAVFTNGIKGYLRVGTNLPAFREIFFQMFPPIYMPAVQIPITLLGVLGLIIGLLRFSKEWFLLIMWFISDIIFTYFIRLQSHRVILIIGFCLISASAFFISELDKIYFQKSGILKSHSSVIIVLLIVSTLSFTYLPRYRKETTVDENYLLTDEYVISTWLAEEMGLNFRVYMMWGSHFKGSQWCNTFYPNIKQVLGGNDEGALMEKDDPFLFDYIVKEGKDANELHTLALKYNVKYIVIDKTYMQTKSNSYKKFFDSTYFSPITEINRNLAHASVYEAYGVEKINDTHQKDFVYWTTWKILGLSCSLILLPLFFLTIRRLNLNLDP
jgi:hypothetical protein